MEFVIDKIGNAYKGWQSMQTIYITAPTGTGKTKFVLEKLYRFAVSEQRKILYLVNRKILKQQLLVDLGKIQTELYLTNQRKNVTEYISVMTYQEIEKYC